MKDILEDHTPQIPREALKEPKKLKKTDVMMKRPSGMNREVYALLYSDSKDSAMSSTLMPTDTGSGYRQPKARLGRKHARAWQWISFTNPAREDGLVLSHWRRVADEAKPYAFAQFNKSVDAPVYSKEEYTKYLTEENWSMDETDHLVDLCQQFDVRFSIVQDRFDSERYQKRSTEDLKERYYSVCNRLTKARNPISYDEGQLIAYDAPHERRRKLQLERLLNRTSQQVEQEETLVAELKKIEMRKKEREKKQQDLQKLISAAEQNTDSKKSSLKKSFSSSIKKLKGSSLNPTQPKTESSVVFKSYDKSAGVSLRCSKTKTPMTLGQKKAKMIEQLLEEIGVGPRPMPTEQICVQFNDLRNDILLVLDLKAARDACEFELQALKHRYESLPSARQGKIALHDLAVTSSKKPLSSGLQQLTDMPATSSSGRKRRATALTDSVKKYRKS